MITFASSISKALLPSVPFVTQLETEHVSRQTSLPTRAILSLASRLAAGRIDACLWYPIMKSDRIIVLSEMHTDSRLKGCPNVEQKALVIPPAPLLRVLPGKQWGSPTARPRSALGVEPSEFLIAYYGYVYAAKGIETLFKAFQILNAQEAMRGSSWWQQRRKPYLILLRSIHRTC